MSTHNQIAVQIFYSTFFYSQYLIFEFDFLMVDEIMRDSLINNMIKTVLLFKNYGDSKQMKVFTIKISMLQLYTVHIGGHGHSFYHFSDHNNKIQILLPMKNYLKLFKTTRKKSFKNPPILCFLKKWALYNTTFSL